MIRVLALMLAIVAAHPAFAFDAQKKAGIDQRLGAVVPLDLPFRDERGTEVTLRALAHGKPMLLAPVVHDCPNICGVTLAGLLAAVDKQDLAPGRDFSIVAFGIDPREQPQDAASSLDKLRQAYPPSITSAVHGLTGPADSIAAVTQSLGYRYAWDQELQQYAHAAAVAVLDSDGRLSRWLYGVAPDPTDLKLALVDAGRHQIGTWTDQLLLLCYHYDAATGRYGSLIWTLLQAGSVITVIALTGWIAVTLLRDRRSARRAP
ncbi:MAG TPA: SCO family protein [Dongiaceae bacterium]|jgi:protein SCO1/2